jgi:hypothetical protein
MKRVAIGAMILFGGALAYFVWTLWRFGQL